MKKDAITTDGFRRLAYLAVAVTFLLVVVGGIVRISDSGLGCGPEGAGSQGWPLCGGRVVPLIDANMIIEYSHRILAAVLAISIGLLAFLARRRYRDNRPLVRVTTAAFGLVLFQAALGGLTVEKGLKEELVAAHLGVAMLQIGLLILAAYLAGGPAEAASPSARRLASTPQVLRVLSVAATGAVLATIVAGGYMSASELKGTSEQSQGVHTACGNEFPSCGGEFMPFGRSRQLDIHLTHRAFMYLASALVLTLLAAALRLRRQIDPLLVRTVAAATGVLAVQVLLGALNVWLGEHAWLIVIHLTVGTLLWCTLVLVSLIALRAPRRVAVRAPKESAQAVPA
jgi:cytochrome c oxidase assembly protein subunit 15